LDKKKELQHPSGVSQLFKIKNAAGTFGPQHLFYVCFFMSDHERNTMAAGYG